MKKLNNDWFHAALIRAVRTFAQTALSMLTLGLAITEVEWVHILSVSTVSAIYSLLTSLSTGLPEAKMDGTLTVEDNGEKLTYHLDLDSDIDTLGEKHHVMFKVVQPGSQK